MDRRALSNLKRLLLSRDLDAVRQGVELAASLGDGEVVDELLADVHYDGTSAISFSRHPYDPQPLTGTGKLVSERVFVGNGKDQPWFDQALLGLVARGPGEQAAALRAQVRTLTYGCWNHGDPPVDLGMLVGFDALEDLLAVGSSGLENCGALGRLPRLRRARLCVPDGASVGGLEGIAASRSLMELEIRGRGTLSALAGSAVEKLTVVDEDCDDLDGIARMPALRDLFLRVKGPFHGLDGAVMERLEIERARATPFLTGAGALPRLRSLRCWMLDGVTAAPELEELHVQEVREGPAFPRLRRAEVESVASVGRHPERFPALEELDCSSLSPDHFADLARLPKLHTVRMRNVFCRAKSTDGAPPLAYLWGEVPLARLTFVRHVESLRDVARLGPIRDLVLSECSKLTSLDGLQELTTLRTLDLRGCTSLRDASAIAGLDLRAIAVFNCPLGLEGGLPESVRWAITKAQEPDLEKLGAREPPARKAKKKAAAAPALDEAVWARIAEKIRDATQETVNEAADLVREAGLPAYERLLRGASFQDGTFRGSGLGLAGTSVEKQELYRRLVAEAPEGCKVAAELRPKVHSLDLDGMEGASAGRRLAAEIDLSALPAFPNLAEVHVHRARGLRNTDAWGGCRSLRKVTFYQVSGALEARWFAGTPVRTLQGASMSLAGAAGIRGLREYRARWAVRGAPPELAELEGCAELEEVDTVRLGGADLRRMPRLRVLSAQADGPVEGLVSPSLQELELHGVTSVGDLRGLVSLRKLALTTPRGEGSVGRSRNLDRLGPLPFGLTELRLGVPGIGEAPRLESLRALARVEIGSWAAGDDLGWLARLPALRSLKFGSAPMELSALHALPVEEVEISVLHPAQVQALEAHPTLRRVKTPWDGLLPERLRGGP